MHDIQVWLEICDNSTRRPWVTGHRLIMQKAAHGDTGDWPLFCGAVTVIVILVDAAGTKK